jgi:CheY-like chemotaxis protein
VIAVTALAMSLDRDRAIEAGFSEYLAKPVQPKEIVATIKRFLDFPA